MPALEVIAYVRQMRASGYSNATIRQNLLSSGYTAAEADNALAYFNRKPTSLSLKPIVIGGGIAVAVIIILLLVFIPSGTEFTVTTRPISVEVRAGTSVTFADVFTYKGDVESIELTHDLVAPATGNLIVSVDETVKPVAQTTSKILLPDDLTPGRYLVRTHAKAGRYTTESSFSFKVLAKTSTPAASTPDYAPPEPSAIPSAPAATPPPSCNDYDPCTEDNIVDNRCVSTPLAVCCGDYICNSDLGETTSTCSRDCAEQPEAKSTVDILADAQQLSASDPERAQLLCGTLAQVSDADQCYDQVARTGGFSAACGKIGVEKQRDSCLLYFAINKDDFSVCNSITDANLQSSCYSFRNLHDLQIQSAS